MKKTILAAAWLVLWTANPGSGAADPMDVLQGPVEQVVRILQRSPTEPEAKEAQRKELWEIVSTVFDFDVVTDLALGRNRTRFTDQEKKDFTEVFSEFLANNYLNRIQGNYRDEKVVFVGRQIDGSKAVVTTKIVRENQDIPVDYRMLLLEGRWRVYDVNIEGVSLVKNYRTQFDKFFMNRSAAQLIERFRKRVEQQRKGETVPEEARGRSRGADLLALVHRAG